MKTLKPLLLSISIIGLTTFVSQVSSAQPTGSLTNQITGSTNVLWDFGQLTNELQNIELNIQSGSHGQTNEVDVTFAAPYTQNGKGKLAGSGTNQVVLVTDN